ncbi:DUF4139 domain-containing protein [Caenibius tardaugens]|nr:hypothetical protein [Caenibius tardaugens]AZI35649.1 hypothetical protein EGO55_06445 [Caenibius tardaugens NBRC 16725]
MIPPRSIARTPHAGMPVRRRVRLFIALLLAAGMPWLGGPAQAQDAVTSPAPDAVHVTIYRAPDRSPDENMDLQWLGGYALVTETRTVTIPQGKAILRFEGVAAGMLPESAIVTGLPKGVREKNLDADLLSPGNLFARSFGRPVTLRRTDPASGTVREEPAIIRSGLAGSAILQTRSGFEAANCGLQDEILFGDVPADLSAKPTLSVATDADRAETVTLSLSYLAWGFDWQGNYVIQMHEDGRKADILAWVTLASSDVTSFPGAETSVVGGEVNREDEAAGSPDRGQTLSFHCYFRPVAEPPIPMPMAPMPAPVMSEIIVTAQRRAVTVMDAPLAVTVIEEELGDLKLYRVPVPTTVAAMGQKQVALFQVADVKLEPIYIAPLDGTNAGDVRQTLRLRNRKEDGLGRALPAGQVVVFQPVTGTPVLSGEGVIRDSAIGQTVDIDTGDATQVHIDVQQVGERKGYDEYEVVVSNANPWPIQFEAPLRMSENYRFEKISGRIEKHEGQQKWRARIPANGTATLRYRLHALP